MGSGSTTTSPARGGGAGVGRVVNKRLTTADFIARAQETHGAGTYDYSEAVYLNRRQKVKITCPVHGAFEQLPLDHCKGDGCQLCGWKKAAKARSHTTESFIAAAQKLHGVGTYDYSEVVYRGSGKKVTIACPVHGSFEQVAGSHILSTDHLNGCPACARIRIATKNRNSTEAFITKAESVYGAGRYDYLQVAYVDGETKVKVICPQHGAFEHTPRYFLKGYGCPACSRIFFTKGRKSTLYLIRLYDESESFYKIGVTSREVKFRIKRLENDTGYIAEVIAICHAVDFATAHEWEQRILKSFAHLRYRPQKRFGGKLECFSSAKEILSIFPQ
jgi:hypothetical protein